jgi:hypothetical protein
MINEFRINPKYDFNDILSCFVVNEISKSLYYIAK